MPKRAEDASTDADLPATGGLMDLHPDRQDNGQSLLDPEVLALGRRIVDELGGEEASLLSRWAAFRVAELIHIAASATDPETRRAATGSCTELVLRIWQERGKWPQGWPPPAAGDLVSALRTRSRWQRAAIPSEPAEYTWTNTLPAIIDALDNERALWTLAALAEHDADTLASWLDQDGVVLGTEERELLSSIRDAVEDAPDRLRALLFDESVPNAGRAAKGDAVSRAKTVLKALQQSGRSRIKIAQQVVAASDPRTINGAEHQRAPSSLRR